MCPWAPGLDPVMPVDRDQIGEDRGEGGAQLLTLPTASKAAGEVWRGTPGDRASPTLVLNTYWLGFSSVSAFSSPQLDHTSTLDPYP